MWIAQKIIRPLYAKQMQAIMAIITRIRWVINPKLKHAYDMRLNNVKRLTTAEGWHTLLRTAYKYRADRVIGEWYIIALILIPIAAIIGVIAGLPWWTLLIAAELDLLAMGLVDYDSGRAEFFTFWGDCDDVARWSYKFYLSIGVDCYVIHLWSGLQAHRECVYWSQDNASWMITNYGRPIKIENTNGDGTLEAANKLRSDINYDHYIVVGRG
jgi:hypothetical protein